MVDESAVSGYAPEKHVRLLAEAKAGDISARFPNRWVIGADTEVVIERCVLGKPRNSSEARAMLLALSGRPHRVLTGYCICRKDRERSISDTVETKVEFRPLTEDDITWYIGTGEPFDKAGGYGVQGFGAVLIKRIEGSYTNVVGLPLCEIMEHLLREGAVRRP
jgi:septum formation protein